MRVFASSSNRLHEGSSSHVGHFYLHNVLVDIVTDRREWTALGEGYRLDAHIRVYERADALQIPSGALFRSGAQWMVFSVKANGRARQTMVTVGHRNENFTEILDGLRANERVVLYPSDSVRDGRSGVRLPAPQRIPAECSQ